MKSVEKSYKKKVSSIYTREQRVLINGAYYAKINQRPRRKEENKTVAINCCQDGAPYCLSGKMLDTFYIMLSCHLD